MPDLTPPPRITPDIFNLRSTSVRVPPPWVRSVVA